MNANIDPTLTLTLTLTPTPAAEYFFRTKQNLEEI